MSRKVTPEERNMLLENPELVMFDPYKAVKSHTVSLGKALIAPAVTGVILLVWALLCPEFMNAHPKLFAGIGCAALVIACGSVPVLYLVLDTRAYRNAKEQHYARQLRQLLPEDLECSIAHVLSVTVQNIPDRHLLGQDHPPLGCGLVNGTNQHYGFGGGKQILQVRRFILRGNESSQCLL